MTVTFEQVLDVLPNERAYLAGQWVQAFSQTTPQQAAAFAKRLATLSKSRRHDVIEQLVDAAKEDFSVDFSALLRPLIADQDPVLRRLAIEGLWEDEGPDLAALLLKTLAHDPDNEVRAAAATGLGRFVFLCVCEELPPRLCTRIRQALEHVIADPHEDLDVARRAVETIAFDYDDAVARIIDRAYADERPTMRHSAMFAMGRSADKRWADLVLTELQSVDPAMRYEAVRASAEMQLRQAVSRLIPMVGEADEDLREAAIWAMGQIGGPVAERALTRLADSENEELAAMANEALEEAEVADQQFEMLRNLKAEGELAEKDDEDDEDDDLTEDDWDLDDEEDELDDKDRADDETEWPDEFLDLG
jgi:HEAT repeat protein